MSRSLLLIGVVLGLAATCVATEPQVIVYEDSPNAPGTYSGDEKAPLSVVWGQVGKITKQGPPLQMQMATNKVKLSKVWYEGSVAKGGLVKPTKGRVEGIALDGKNLTVIDPDISKGSLDTKELGKVVIFFSSSLTSESCIIAATPEQLEKLKKLAETPAVPDKK